MKKYWLFLAACLLVVAFCVFLLLCAPARARGVRPEASCATYDSSSGVFNTEAGCSAVERFVDCEAGVVCYLSQFGMSCLPIIETNVPHTGACRKE